MKKIPTIVAIGGGEMHTGGTLPIDKKIIELTGKKKPKVLFIPTASGDSESYYAAFQKIYGEKLGCKTDVLNLVQKKFSKAEIEKKILSSDAIYVGGGSTLNLMKVWRRLGVDKILAKAHRKGVILSGLSAGANCWFRYSSSDSRLYMKGKDGRKSKSRDLMRVRGLDLIPLTMSPHHVREVKVRNPGLKKMMQKTPGVALATDDNAAIVVRGDEYQIITSQKNVGVKKVFRVGQRITSINLPSEGLLENLLSKE